MPDWRCSRCCRRISSKSYPINAAGASVWSSYRTIDVHAARDDKLCSRCQLEIRKSCGDMPGHRKKASKVKRPCNCSGTCKFEMAQETSQDINDPSSLSSRSSAQSIVSESTDTQSPVSFDLNMDFFQNGSEAENSWELESLGSARSKNSTSKLSMVSAASHRISRSTVLGIKSLIATQRKCCICSSMGSRKVVPQPARIQMWGANRVWIPKSNRCCASHLHNNLFTTEAIQSKPVTMENAQMNSDDATGLVTLLSDMAFRRGPLVDFDDVDLSEEDYHMLIGYPKASFDELVDHCSGIKNSTNRSKRNAVAMLLMQLRLNLTQRVLQFLFHVKNMSTISETLESVLSCLEKNFVPKHLGYEHMTRQEVIDKHSVPAFDQLLMSRLDDEEDAPLEARRLQLVFDGTYLFIQKSTNFETQRRTYSQQKCRNLVKPMMVVTATGYILEASSVYLADYKNNDASILEHMIKTTNLLNYFKIGDHAIVDRGFRDVIDKLDGYGVYTHMPELLPKTSKQFSSLNGDRSRKVTMIRWIVEAANGRIKKKFRFFDEVIKLSYLPKVGRLFRLACSIINAFSPPLFTPSDDHSKLVAEAVSKVNLENSLFRKLDTQKLLTARSIWVPATQDSVPGFPRLSAEDLTMITLGVYQIRMASLYTEQHLDGEGDFNLFIHLEQPSLLKAKLQSRFTTSHHHTMWVEFQPNGEGARSVTGLYCTCKTGARTIGTCSHLTTVLWFLGNRRHQTQTTKRRSLASGILDAAERFAEDNMGIDSSEDEENNPPIFK